MNIQFLIETNFKGATRPEIIEVAKVLGVRTHHMEKDATVINNIMEFLGKEAVEITEGESVELGHGTTSVRPHGILPAINLASAGKWQGRRMRVKLHETDDDNKKNIPKYVSWESLEMYIPCDIVCDIPWPIYHIIRNAVTGILQQKFVTNDDGATMAAHSWRDKSRIPMDIIEVTPGTEALPCSLLEHFKQEEIIERLGLGMITPDNKEGGYTKLELRRAFRMLDIPLEKGVKLNQIHPDDLLEEIYDFIGHDIFAEEDESEVEAA